LGPLVTVVACAYMVAPSDSPAMMHLPSARGGLDQALAVARPGALLEGAGRHVLDPDDADVVDGQVAQAQGLCQFVQQAGGHAVHLEGEPVGGVAFDGVAVGHAWVSWGCMARRRRWTW